MTAFARLVVVCACAAWSAQAQYAEERAPRYIASEAKAPATTPVPILKQINRHNEDGSYTYGYEAADGSFKIETKSPVGEVKGKYGYRDDTGKLRVVEYGANKFGFQPAGEGITVAPPTLVDESAKEDQRQNKEQGNRNQYRQQQQPDYDYEDPAPAPPPRPAPRPQPQPAYRAPQPQQQYRPAPQPQQQYRPAPQQQPQQQYRAPQPQPQQQFRPAPQSSGPTPPKPQFFAGAAPAQDNFFNPEPAPAPRQYKPKQPDFRPAPQVQDYQSFAPAPNPEPRFAPSNFQQPQNRQSFSMLDQLLKEYSLPSGGSAPLHDITFGSY